MEWKPAPRPTISDRLTLLKGEIEVGDGTRCAAYWSGRDSLVYIRHYAHKMTDNDDWTAISVFDIKDDWEIHAPRSTAEEKFGGGR